MQRQLEKLDEDGFYYLELPQIVKPTKKSHSLPWQEIHWAPVVSMSKLQELLRQHEAPSLGRTERPGRYERKLVKNLRKMCLEVVSSDSSEGKLARSVCGTLLEAKRLAVGTDAEESKRSWMERNILGHPRRYSGRAVLTPWGLPTAASMAGQQEGAGFASSGLLPGVNEISVPESVAEAVEKVQAERAPGDRPHHETQLRADSMEAPGETETNVDRLFHVDPDPVVWLKRDPVLHRWGVLPVHYHVHNDSSKFDCRRRCSGRWVPTQTAMTSWSLPSRTRKSRSPTSESQRTS